MRDYVVGMKSLYTYKSYLPEQGLVPCLLGKLSFGGSSFGGLQWRRTAMASKKNPGVLLKTVLIVSAQTKKKSNKNPIFDETKVFCTVVIGTIVIAPKLFPFVLSCPQYWRDPE